MGPMVVFNYGKDLYRLKVRARLSNGGANVSQVFGKLRVLPLTELSMIAVARKEGWLEKVVDGVESTATNAECSAKLAIWLMMEAELEKPWHVVPRELHPCFEFYHHMGLQGHRDVGRRCCMLCAQ